jgi:peptidoglycan hydrolase-like protein with peptidoglycan-binding domain
MGSDRIRVPPVSAFCARRAGIVAAVLALLLPPAVATAATNGAGTGGTGSSGTPRTASPAGSLGSRALKRGMTGTAVRTLQRWLGLAGFSLAVDGRFGPATQRAVRSFQRAHRLKATGIVDRGTARALTAAAATAPITPQIGGDVRARIAAVARSQIGQGENPRGSNCTRYGPCEAWCADFATWVWRQAGVTGIGRIAWVPDLVTWGKRHGSWKPGYLNDPKTGDMVIFSGLHVGVVERVTASTITIIAGNTSTNNVARRGPASPADGYAMGPAAISGYVSPVPASVAARATAAAPLPRPTAAQMAAQDPQDRNPRLAAQEH